MELGGTNSILSIHFAKAPESAKAAQKAWLLTGRTAPRLVNGSRAHCRVLLLGQDGPRPHQLHLKEGHAMRTFHWLLLMTASLFVGSACMARQQASGLPAYAPTATVKDLMDSFVDPSADVVWNSVASVTDANGIENRTPRTDEEWTNVRHGAIRLVEATNLLLMPGRHVARPGEKSETPGVELEPEQMEALLNKDRAAWDRRAKALHDASVAALQAIDAKDGKKLFDVGEQIDTACENCHTQYWYPNEKIPQFPSELSSRAR